MTRASKITYFFTAMIFFIVFDLYFSEFIVNSLRFNRSENPIFDLTFVQNTGAAFSIFENSKIFLIAFSVIAIVLIIFYAVKNAEKYSVMAGFWAAMLVAGVSCNMYERFVFGFVRDFFKLKFIDFPVFNISDVFINIGVLAVIVIIVKNKYIKK